MRFLILFSAAILASLFFLRPDSYARGGVKLVGVYDRDSVLAKIPDYRQALDSAESYRHFLNKKLDALDSTVKAKEAEFRQDSAKWSGAEKEQKRKELNDAQSKSASFEDMIDYNSETVKTGLLDEVNEKINKVASELADKKKFATVVSKQEFSVLFPDQTGIKVTNVTAQMIQGLLQPKK